MTSAFTLIDEHEPRQIQAHIEGDRVLLSPEVLAEALGWRLEDEGLCRGDTCIPRAGSEDLLSREGVDLAALAARLGRPLALDLDHRVAALAAAPVERARRLAGLEAPDFTLPDLGGRLHALSDHRGKKVLLIAYASW